MTDATQRFSNQPGYWHTVYTGATVSTPMPQGSVLATAQDRTSAALHGLFATLLALGLAFTSVYGHKLKKSLRLGSFLETGLQPLRALQSGHPGDYVLWIVVGAALFGTLSTLLLR